MVRYLLLFLLVILITRAAWRLVGGVMRGLAEHSQPRAGGGVPTRGVQMVRDPVCGTYVLPDRALMLTDGSRQVFFCSAECRDKYRARPSTRSA
jgi:YHS domain-containing protein